MVCLVSDRLTVFSESFKLVSTPLPGIVDKTEATVEAIYTMTHGETELKRSGQNVHVLVHVHDYERLLFYMYFTVLHFAYGVHNTIVCNYNCATGQIPCVCRSLAYCRIG